MKLSSLLVFITLFFCIHGTANAETIVLSADRWCPYTCAPNSSNPGYLIDVAREVFGKHGIRVEYRVAPWTRAVGDARSGAVNGVAGALRNDAPDFIFPAREIGYNHFGFFSYATSWKYTSPNSLPKQPIGTAKGYSYGKAIDGLIATGKIKTLEAHGSNPLRQNIIKLRQGRFPLLIAERAVLQYTAKKIGLNHNLRYVGSPDTGNKMHIAFSPSLKSSKRYAAILSTGIEELRLSGKLKKILSRYGLKDWR